MAVFLFSMAGIPPTAGFAAKYLLFYSAIQAHEIPLVVISVLCSAISVYYYLRVLVYMYMRDPAEQPSEQPAAVGLVGRGRGGDGALDASDRRSAGGRDGRGQEGSHEQLTNSHRISIARILAVLS